MYPNKESGLGAKMMIALFDNAMFGNATTGRVFIVAKSGIVNESEIKAIYGNNYPDGTPVIFTTITLALAQCLASRGDVILVAPGHTETITGAAGIAANVAGVTIVGVGNGSLRPTISFTTAITASFDITAANMVFKNIVFSVGFDALTAMINVNSADVTFDTCEFNTNTGAFGVVLGILSAATAVRLKIVNCRFLGSAVNAGTTTTAQIKHEVGVDYLFQNNYFTGKMTQAILNATALLRGLIDNNRFVVSTGTLAISVHASSTPFITNNRINVPSGTAPVVAAAGFLAGNAYSAAAGVTAGTALTW
jgi:hypothetical protein